MTEEEELHQFLGGKTAETQAALAAKSAAPGGSSLEDTLAQQSAGTAPGQQQPLRAPSAMGDQASVYQSPAANQWKQPTFLDRTYDAVTGRGESDPTISDRPPPLPEGAGVGDYLSMGASRLLTSDQDALANIYLKHYPGSKADKDRYGATIVTLKDGYKFHPMPPGYANAPALMGLAGQAATDTAALATGGISRPLVQAGKMALAQGVRGELGAAAGSGETQGDIGGQALGAGLFSRLADFGAHLGGRLWQRGRVITSPGAGEATIGPLLAKHGYDFDALPDATKRAMVDKLKGHSPEEVEAALSDRKNADAFWNAQAAEDLAGKNNTTLGQVTGDQATLDREAQRARAAPNSALAQQPSDVVPEKMAGLLDPIAARGTTTQAGSEVSLALKSVPEKAAFAEKQAWDELATQHGSTRLPAVVKTGQHFGAFMEKQFPLGLPDPASSPQAMQAIQDLVGTAPPGKRGMPIGQVVEARQRIAEQLAAGKGEAGDLRDLAKVRDGLDNYLRSVKDPEAKAAVEKVFGAADEVAKLRPDAPMPDEASTLIRDLMHDPGNVRPDAAYSMVRDIKDPEKVAHFLVQKFGFNHDAVRKLGGGYLQERLLDGGGGSVAKLGASDLAVRLKAIDKDPFARELFPPGELAEMRRAQTVLENMAKRGEAQGGAWNVIRNLSGNVAALGILGSAMAMKPWAAIALRRQIAPAARNTVHGMFDLAANRRADAAFDIPAIVNRPPAASPEVRAGMEAIGATQGAGLLDQRTPLAVEGRGLLGGQ